MYCKKCGSILSRSSSDCLCPVCRTQANVKKEEQLDTIKTKAKKTESENTKI